MPPSLYKYDYVDEVEIADTPEEEEKAKLKWVNEFIFARENAEDESKAPEENKEGEGDGEEKSKENEDEEKTKEEEEDDEYYQDQVVFEGGPDEDVADLAMLGGNFELVMENFEQWLSARDWDDINLLLELSEYYLCDYTQENIDRLVSMIDYNSHYKLVTTEDPRLFNSSEVIKVIYGGYGELRDLGSEKRAKYGKGAEFVVSDNTANYNVVDTKTGLEYTALLAKSEEFEKTLLDPNTELILGIIRGDVSVFLQSEHALAQGDPEGRRAKTYMALTGLQSYRNKKQKQSVPLKEYLGILSNKLESEMACLEEILAFVTGKPVVSEITSILEIDDATADFLLINIKEKVSTKEDEEDDQETEEKVSIIDIISKRLNMPTKDLEVFDIIRNIYQYRKQPGWMDALRLLTNEKRYKVQKEVLKSNPKTQKQNVPLPKHPLAKLFKMINFGTLKKQTTTSGEEKNFLAAIQTQTRGNEDEQMEKVFDYVLGQDIYKYNDQQKATLKQQHSAIRLLLKLNFREAFKQLVLSVPQKDSSMYPVQNAAQNILGSILELFGVKATTPEVKRDVKFLKIFLLLTQDNLKALKNNQNSNVTVESIIEDMVQLDFLTSIRGDPERQRRICQILLATLAWDSKLVIESFAQEGTLEEGYLLYNIYTCFNLSKLKDKTADLKWNFLALLTYSVGPLISKAGANLFAENKDSVADLLAYRNLEAEQSLSDLQTKIKGLFETIQNNSSEPLISFLYDVGAVTETLETNNLVRSLTSIVVSLSDFSFLQKLLRTHVSPTHEKDMHDRIKLLYDLLIKVEDFYTYGEYPYVNEDFRMIIESAEKEAADPAQLGPLRALQSLLPDIMFIYLRFQSDVDYTDQIKLDIVRKIRDVQEKMPESTQKEFIGDMVSVILGTNIATLPAEDANVKNLKLKIDYGVDHRTDILFNIVRRTFFPSVDGKEAFENGNWFKQSFSLVKRLRNDFLTSLKDAQKRRGAAKNVLKIFMEFQLCHHDLMDALFAMQDGDLTRFELKMTRIAPTLGIPADSLPSMVSYLKEAQNLLSGDFFTKQSQLAQPAVVQAKTNVNSEDWIAMVKKIKEGTASSKDLFKMVDEAGDGSGSINETEFMTLAGRLNLKLSSHRVKEIFAKVKGGKADASNQELNEAEFDQALTYLQEKNLQQALLLLGITPEILAGVLIRLTILLLLLFVFIFLGIKAFAVGGTFGSIINSLFPMAGGTALGKESESDKGKLEDTSVKEATSKGFEITTSEQL